jgi:hypothetical protein
MKYSDFTLGEIEAVLNKLGGREGVRKFLSGELIVQEPARCWREEDGVIYFEVTSDGTTGPEWIKRLEKNGFRVSDYAKSLLRSPDFISTNGVTTKIVVLPGKIFEDSDRITKKIRVEAERRGFVKVNAETACLAREVLSDKDLEAMGLWWITIFHDPIEDSDGDPSLLTVDRHGDGRWLSAYYVRPDVNWNSGNGFAFALPQV